jgi:hypothetical protein
MMAWDKDLGLNQISTAGAGIQIRRDTFKALRSTKALNSPLNSSVPFTYFPSLYNFNMPQRHDALNPTAREVTSFGSPFWAELGVDMASAVTSALIVSPFVYVIDKSLMASASGKTTFRKEFASGLKLLASKPWQLVTKRMHRLPFAWMYALYGATYVVENGIGRILKYANHPAESITPYPLSGHLHHSKERTADRNGHDDTGTFIKFSATALTNVVLCTLKDRAYTQIFASGIQKAIPRSSYSLFIVRDSLTVASSFNLPDVIGRKMSKDYTSLSEKQWTTVFQFVCPVTMQFISAPLHILAIDGHVNPNKSVSARWGTVGRQYMTTSLARAARILPAFGLGGVCNNRLKEWGAQKLQSRYEQPFQLGPVLMPQPHH